MHETSNIERPSFDDEAILRAARDLVLELPGAVDRVTAMAVAMRLTVRDQDPLTERELVGLRNRCVPAIAIALRERAAARTSA